MRKISDISYAHSCMEKGRTTASRLRAASAWAREQYTDVRLRGFPKAHIEVDQAWQAPDNFRLFIGGKLIITVPYGDEVGFNKAVALLNKSR